MGIDLCRGDAAVSQHFLDESKIGTVLKQMSGK